jgi:hypothetical protein
MKWTTPLVAVLLTVITVIFALWSCGASGVAPSMLGKIVERPAPMVTQEPTTREIDAGNELDEAVEDYYKSIDRQDWAYAYARLDSHTKLKVPQDEWIEKNQYLANVDPVVHSPPEIVSAVSTALPVKVRLTQTFQSGFTKIRSTYFVYEGDSWKNRLSKEELDFFLPDAP